MPEDQIMLNLHTGMAELFNRRLSIRVTEGMRQAKLNGRVVGKAPFGYKNATNSQGLAYIEPHENADLIRTIFREFATGLYHPDELRKKLRIEKGYYNSKNAFRALLTNPVYIGKVRVRSFKNQPEHIVDGIHTALVDEDTFLRVQDILFGKKRGSYKKDSDELFPLRGHLLCPSCLRLLTASLSKGNGGQYGYYHCQTPCKCRFRSREVDIDFQQFIKKLIQPPERMELYKEILLDELKRQQMDSGVSTTDLKKKITETEKDLDSLDEKLIKNIIPADRYQAMRDRLTQELSQRKAQLNQLGQIQIDAPKYVNSGFNLLSKLDLYYERSPVAIKKKLIGSIFPEKLIYENSTYRTNGNNEVVALLEGNLNLVGITGFEPVTSRV
ncbi:recombinase family protein [bacterium]|nr:MAG: recombinase family protein [bacterium]